jgi:histidinol phosphatase-like PHP family hydrolase
MPRPPATRDHGDINLCVAGLLGDMAAIQTSPQRKWAYKQAAAAVRDLDAPLDVLVAAAGALPRIPRIGPSSSRIILEVLDSGTSPLVERAVDESGRRTEIHGRRALRQGFLSRAVVSAVLGAAGALPTRCDLQMHSTWSDGRQSLDDVITGCLARGYTHSAITDHSAGLPVARGMPIERFREQWREIDALNRRHRRRFRLLKGVEANILGDGDLDVAPADRREFDLVLVAPHSGLRSAGDQTARLLAAVAQPHVHVLAHPRGRKFATRPGITADWPRVFAAAASRGVAIELDGDPSRQDLDAVLAIEALEAGCEFAVDSDAHDREELRYVDTAMAHARLAGIPVDRIINCWPLERLLDWAARRG